ncbi:alkaline phosphatase family protein, partial [bacterium]|nr:alkaline phosphatase family protein [candidate division CSSED10-310 bacterium]
MMRRLASSALLCLLAAACGSPTPGPQLVIIGLDAASLEIIDPLITSGRLPTFARFRREGVWGPLRTFVPTESPQIWTTIATGQSPRFHGINSFTRRIPGADTTIPLHSSFRSAPAFWDIFPRQGRSVVVVKWWASWPAEYVKGACVSARLEPRLEGGWTYPAGLYEQITTFRFEAAPAKPHGMLFDPKTLQAASNPSAVKPAARLVDIHGEGDQDVAFNDKSVASMGKYVLARFQPEVFAIYFKSIDKIEHLNWEFRNWDAFPEGSTERRRGLEIVEAYEYFDSLLADYLAIAGPESIVVALSDHGMEETKSVTEPYSARSLDADLLLTGLGWQGRYEDGSTDWRTTRAYMYQSKAYSYELEVSLNVAGRERDGMVPPERVETLRNELVGVLEELTTTDGRAVFRSVREGDGSGGDLVCRIEPDLALDDEVNAGGMIRRVRDWVPELALPSGVHITAPEGVFMALGPGISKGTRLETADV